MKTGYKECEKLLKQLKPLGYTFEYGLDGCPINLTKTAKNVNKDMFKVIIDNKVREFLSYSIAKANYHAILNISESASEQTVLAEARKMYIKLLSEEINKVKKGL